MRFNFILCGRNFPGQVFAGCFAQRARLRCVAASPSAAPDRARLPQATERCEADLTASQKSDVVNRAGALRQPEAATPSQTRIAKADALQRQQKAVMARLA